MAYGMYKPRGYGRKVGGRRVGAVRRRRGYGARGARGRIIRSMNPTPTFVETYAKSAINVPSGAGLGQVFGARITDIPQVGQYSNLYKQYRINWIKVMIVPDFSGLASDNNSAAYNAGAGIGSVGMTRVAWAIQDSPGVAAPATEAIVLQDNGAKVKALGSKWSCSFKPVPQVAQITDIAAGTQVYAKQKFKQWFNFDTVLTGNNPFHGACAAFFTLPPSVVPTSVNLNVYYKVSFSLRDPQ